MSKNLENILTARNLGIPTHNDSFFLSFHVLWALGVWFVL